MAVSKGTRARFQKKSTWRAPGPQGRGWRRCRSGRADGNVDQRREAATSVQEDVQAKAPQIRWRKMKGMRNIAAHEYFGIDLSTVWQTATVYVPALNPLVQALLAK